jgi:hypothetical protein
MLNVRWRNSNLKSVPRVASLFQVLLDAEPVWGPKPPPLPPHSLSEVNADSPSLVILAAQSEERGSKSATIVKHNVPASGKDVPEVH